MQVTKISDALHHTDGFDIKPLDQLEVNWAGMPPVSPEQKQEEASDANGDAAAEDSQEAEPEPAGVGSGVDVSTEDSGETAE